MRPWYLSGWFFLGLLWGVGEGLALRYTNQNYETIKATLEGVNTGAPAGPAILVFSVVSTFLLLLLLIVGVIALRQRRGVWRLMLGVAVGIGGSATVTTLHQALG